jgi:hypothetical protein
VSNDLIDGGLSSRVSPHTRRFKRGPLVHTSAGVDEHDRRTCDVLEVYAAALQAVSDGEDPALPAALAGRTSDRRRHPPVAGQADRL